MDEPEACAPGEHTFRRDPETNEPIGRCIRCEASLDWAERQEEDAEPVAFADVPESDHEAYLAALDAESIRENR